MKQIPLIYIHTLCCTVIIVIIACIFIEKRTDFDAELQEEVQAAFQSASDELRRENTADEALFDAMHQAYWTKSGQALNDKVKYIRIETAQILALLDSLRQHATKGFVTEVQADLQAYHALVLNDLDVDKETTSVLLASCMNDGLVRAWKERSSLEFTTLLKQIESDVATIENIAMMNLRKRVASEIKDHSPFEPILTCTPLNPKVGDTVAMDVRLGFYENTLRGTRFRLDGKELTQKQGYGQFNIRYEQPGMYPLRFSTEWFDWKADSFVKYEQTYFLWVN